MEIELAFEGNTRHECNNASDVIERAKTLQ
jgi:hypothetical protein